ncbi:MAG: hypothetical protein M1824_000967 [Vezdaea acicularis]|nr:MAG: hypothetical protein M1824_000967 [Vezdaea acicularis]
MTDWTATHKSQAMEYWKMTGFVDSDAAYHEVTDKMNDYFGAGMFTKVAVMRADEEKEKAMQLWLDDYQCLTDRRPMGTTI